MTIRKSGPRARGMTTTAVVIDRLLATEDSITSGQVARGAGVSRQAAYNRLRAMAERGELIHEGERRGGRFRRTAFLVYRYELDGLREADAWSEEMGELRRRDLPILDNPKIEPLLNFAFTEMLNNAVDHSDGTVADVRWYLTDTYIAFEIADDGIGVFARMAADRSLESEFDAIGEIAKGKQTTDPEHHSGLGIYFSSRMASRFVLTSGQLSFIADGRRDDVAVEWLETARSGTLVRCEFDADTTRTPAQVFQAFAPSTVGAGQRATIRVASSSGATPSCRELRRSGLRPSSKTTAR